MSPHEREPASNTAQTAWVFYEWANQPYFSLITIFLFAPYFTQTVIGDPVAGQALWGYIMAAAGIIIAVASPLLGAMADAAGPRKPWILFFTIFCTIGCSALWFATPDAPVLAIAIAIVVASIGMEFTIIFANAMLPTIASERRMGLLSGIGIGMGQLAAIVALVLVLIFLQLPGIIEAAFIPAEPLFGLSREAHETDRIVGPISGLWFFVFMLPLLFLVPDQASRRLSRVEAAKTGLVRLVYTVRSVRHFRNIAIYLLSRMAFYDGMNAIFIFGGILAASIFGWGAMEMAVYGIWVTIFASFGAFVGGWVDQRFGSKTTLIWALCGTIVTFLSLISFDRDRIFYLFPVEVAENAAAFSTLPQQLFLVAVAAFGLMVGPVIASSRTMMARIAPKEMMTEFFGLFALSGKATTFVAPLLIGMVTVASGSQRLGLLITVPLILAGLIGLLYVREERSPPLAEIHRH